MIIEQLTSVEQAEAIEPEWERLWQSDRRATPFQAPQWLLPWWRCFGGSDDLLLLTMRDEEKRLVALAPFVILREEDESLGLLLGTGVSDYLDALAAPGIDLEPFRPAIAASDCAFFDLHQLRSSSPLLALAPPEGWLDRIEPHEPCPVLTLDGGRPEGTDLSPHARKKLRYFRRSLERLGELTFACPDEKSIDHFLDDLFALHRLRWEERGQPGLLADPVVQSFHRAAAPRMLAAGALRMYALRVASRPVAIFYGFAHYDTVYYYLSGFDPALEKLSPGMVVIGHAIEQAAAGGATSFDFLRGGEGYKYGWGAVDQVTSRRQWSRV